MQLIEIVSSPDTDPVQASRAAAFAHRIDRLPLPVRSSPCFLVNRILLPYLLEAVRLLQEGFTAEQIDQAALDFGMPMGPMELADSVGLDICLSVADKLSEFVGSQVPAVLRHKVDAGALGRKSGQGFYNYTKKGPLKHHQRLPIEQSREISERMILQLLNQSIACLREGVVEDSDLLDAGVVFSTGFAPFRGGPIQYIRTLGWDRIRRQVQRMEQRRGSQFSADTGWEALA